MKITDVKVVLVSGDEKLKASVSIVIDNCVLVRDIKVISGKTGLSVAMPVKKMEDGSHSDLAHLLGKPAMQMIEDRVLVEYDRAWSSEKKPKESVEVGSLDNTMQSEVAKETLKRVRNSLEG